MKRAGFELISSSDQSNTVDRLHPHGKVGIESGVRSNDGDFTDDDVETRKLLRLVRNICIC